MGLGNSFGRLFRISTWGESHGGGVGVTVDGVPPRLPISAEEIQLELTRRRPGQSRLTTPRDEADQVEILSGEGTARRSTQRGLSCIPRHGNRARVGPAAR